MLKKILSSVIMCFGLLAMSHAQFAVTGANPAWEGSTERYTLNVSGWQLPPNLNLQFSATNGIIINSQTDPYGAAPLSVTVQWQCGVSGGNITVQDAGQGFSYTYAVALYSYHSYANFCGTTEPLEQTLVFAQQPAVLQVTDCSPFCAGTYNFTYQWQKAPTAELEVLPYQPGVWTDIAGATSADYTPPAPLTYSAIFYRRVTRFNNTSQLVTLYSAPVIIKFLDYLQPGTLSGGAQITFNTQPVVTTTPATGGQCYTQDYAYSWERSVENGPWQTIGTGEGYPANAPIIGNSRIRRKVLCGGEARYTQSILFTIAYTSPNAENLNYVRTNSIAVPGIQSWAQADQLPTGQKIQNTVYMDGFGRSIQQVSKQASYTGSGDPNSLSSYQDMVGITAFDGLGRADKGYLPYATTTNLGFFKTNTLAEQNTFNNTIAVEPANNPFTYSSVLYDGSPLNRIVHKKGPGYAANTNTQNQGLASDYAVQKGIESVHIWEIGAGIGDMPYTSAVYADGMLLKDIVVDDRGKQIITYKDRAGRAILKKVQEKELGNGLDPDGYDGWLCTYYVFDDLGRLRYTLPPKIVEQMHLMDKWDLTQDMKKDLCFYQEYDKYGNIIIKQSAGAGEIHSVYDNRNRLVLSQDANQRNRGQWAFSLYDENDRAVITGLFTDWRDRATMQTYVSGLNAGNRTVELFTGSTENFTVYNPVAGTDVVNGTNICAPCATTTVNSASYYDTYSNQSLPFEAVTAAQFPSAAGVVGGVLPLEKTGRTQGMVTGSKIRVLNDVYDDGNVSNDRFLTSTVYYNEEGLVLESLGQNIKDGVDKSCVQYAFDGSALSTYHYHSTPSTPFNGLITVTKTDNDLLRRPLKSYLLITKDAANIANNSAYKLTGTLQYDALGRSKTATIGQIPTNVNQPLETQDFSYNILGQLTGINKGYAISASVPSQWSRRFGICLGYDNADGRFASAQFGGQLAGVQWRSQGDNTRRKYDYEYDNVNRFTKAVFTQNDVQFNTLGFTNAKVNLSVTVTGYDANGNIQGLQQWAPAFNGTVGGIKIDELQYNYLAGTNRLQSVDDIAGSGGGNAGDFKDVPGGIDYTYDDNGNLTADGNKGLGAPASGVAGMEYNFLNLPQKTTLTGNAANGGTSSTTDYVYDAAGNKLAKTVTPLNAASGTPSGNPVTSYYVGNYIYKGDDLQYILFAGGRLRAMEPVQAWSGPSGQVNYLERIGAVPLALQSLSPNGGPDIWGVWDYFIQDHLGNTRMVLTEEQYKQAAFCSMEHIPGSIQDPRGEEQAMFGPAVVTTQTARPASWPTTGIGGNTSASVCKLQPVGTNGVDAIGPNVLLKVMAGDMVAATAKYHYDNPSGQQAQNSNILGGLASSLINALNTVPATLVHQNIGNLHGQYSGGGSPLQPFLNGQPTSSSTAPKAYLNYLFFDEQFNYIYVGSNAIPLGSTNTGQLPTNLIRAIRNGYVYIYLSNESTNIPVYFDDFTVSHQRGAIVEDNAYYPHGLRIASISARAALQTPSKYGYQGLYNEIDEATGYNEFALRSYDPQIGRWIQSDPYDVEPGMYNGMGNDPVNVTDPSGGAPFDWGKGLDENGVEVIRHFEGAVPEGWKRLDYGYRFQEKGTGNWFECGTNGRFNPVGPTVTAPGKMTISIRPGEVITVPDEGASLDEKVRFHINLTHDVNFGVNYGAVMNIWGGIKSLAALYSYADPMATPEMQQYRSGVLNGLQQLSLQSQQRYGGNIVAAMLGNYVSGKYNDIAHGDFATRYMAFGAIGSDVGMTLLGMPELRAVKVGLGTADGGTLIINGLRTYTEAEMATLNGGISGWVERNVFNTLDPHLQSKVVAAIEKGFVTPVGRQGIIKLTAHEAAETGYLYKIKILGKGGDIRIYGNPMKNGHILFDKIMGH